MNLQPIDKSTLRPLQLETDKTESHVHVWKTVANKPGLVTFRCLTCGLRKLHAYKTRVELEALENQYKSIRLVLRRAS